MEMGCCRYVILHQGGVLNLVIQNHKLIGTNLQRMESKYFYNGNALIAFDEVVEK